MNSPSKQDILTAFNIAMERLSLQKADDCPGVENTVDMLQSANPFVVRKALRHCDECMTCLFHVESQNIQPSLNRVTTRFVTKISVAAAACLLVALTWIFNFQSTPVNQIAQLDIFVEESYNPEFIGFGQPAFKSSGQNAALQWTVTSNEGTQLQWDAMTNGEAGYEVEIRSKLSNTNLKIPCEEGSVRIEKSQHFCQLAGNMMTLTNSFLETLKADQSYQVVITTVKRPYHLMKKTFQGSELHN